MIDLIFVLILLGVGAGSWFAGLWSNMITLVCLIFAGLIATSLFEPLAGSMEESMGSYTYLLDFACIWIVFFFSFGFLRLITELMSPYRVKFNIVLEMVGRSILSIWIAWAFLCFSMFTVHLAPIDLDSFQSSPNDNNFMGMGPDRMWMAFVQSRSMGTFSEFRDSGMLPEYNAPVHPDDEDSNNRVFDSTSEFILKYRDRREKLAELDDFLVEK